MLLTRPAACRICSGDNWCEVCNYCEVCCRRADCAECGGGEPGGLHGEGGTESESDDEPYDEAFAP